MKKFVATLIATAAMISAAIAADLEGVVKSYDEATRTVTLEDGATYVLPEGVEAAALTAGTKVKLSVDDTSKAVTAITAMQ